jgi:hypothetical protein
LWGDRLYQFASGIVLGPVYSGRLLADLQTFDPCMEQYPTALHFYRADEELLGYLRENLVALFAAVRNGNPQIVEQSRSGGSNEILFVRWGHAPARLQNIQKSFRVRVNSSYHRDQRRMRVFQKQAAFAMEPRYCKI